LQVIFSLKQKYKQILENISDEEYPPTQLGVRYADIVKMSSQVIARVYAL
jgi:hypothetical protein